MNEIKNQNDKKFYNDISDDEVRLIRPQNNRNLQNEAYNEKSDKLKKRKILWIVIATVIVVVVIIAAVIGTLAGRNDNRCELAGEYEQEMNVGNKETIAFKAVPAENTAKKGYSEIRDISVNGNRFKIYQAINATPSLMVGPQTLNDPQVVLAFQAADLRGDNWEIACAFIDKGELLSRGIAKSGFCAIIDGTITIGVADSTPLFEEAMITDGYFFRQYPLVVGGQVVENKPKGKSMRKALAEINGEIVVVSSQERLTLHEFSKDLVDMGVQTAIYLVGSDSAGVYKDKDGKRLVFGHHPEPQMVKFLNFIVWK